MSASTWDRFAGKLRQASRKKSVRTPFEVQMSDGHSVRIGDGEPRFWLESRSAGGDRALASLDLFR